MELSEVSVVSVSEEEAKFYIETDNDRLVMALMWLILPVSFDFLKVLFISITPANGSVLQKSRMYKTCLSKRSSIFFLDPSVLHTCNLVLFCTRTTV